MQVRCDIPPDRLLAEAEEHLYQMYRRGRLSEDQWRRRAQDLGVIRLRDASEQTQRQARRGEAVDPLNPHW